MNDKQAKWIADGFEMVLRMLGVAGVLEGASEAPVRQVVWKARVKYIANSASTRAGTHFTILIIRMAFLS